MEISDPQYDPEEFRMERGLTYVVLIEYKGNDYIPSEAGALRDKNIFFEQNPGLAEVGLGVEFHKLSDADYSMYNCMPIAFRTDQTGVSELILNGKKVRMIVAGGWQNNENGWWFDNGDGTFPKSTFQTIGGKTFYFDADGYMVREWIEVDNDWYYMGTDGVMVKDQAVGEYYVKEDGRMAKNEEIINLKKEDCDLFINDDLYEFNSSFKPEKKGEYKIKLLFKKRLKNCSYMFNNCDNIIKLDLSLFNSSEIMNMHYMFGKCHFLNEINLTSFKTDKVINMSYLFNKCSNLETIVFSESFDTSNVEDMSFMFHNCYFLKKISFPNSFITKKVKSMECMFRNCYNLKQLDLKNFETNEVINLSYMFDGCCELTEILIDSDKFKTDKVKEMGKMFNGCTNLENVNIKEFNYPNIKRMDQMFKSCEKLNEINLSKLKLNDQINIYNIFEDLKDVKVIVNKESVDKFKKQNKDINYITN